MVTTLEGGEGAEFDAGVGVGVRWDKTPRGGRVRRTFGIHELAHRSL